MNQITSAGNTVVPALLSLESLGFEVVVSANGDRAECRVTRGDESYVADDPVTVIGLVRLVELRGWNWAVSDSELDAAIQRFGLTEQS